MTELWDITPPLSAATPVFPGDTPFGFEWLAQCCKGASANVSTITLSPHVGAHVDAPLHLSDVGHDVSQYSLERFLGPCVVIDLSDALPNKQPKDALIGAEYLSDEVWTAITSRTVPRVLFKTRKERPLEWTEAFYALKPELVFALALAGVRLIGIDTPSIDPATSETLDAHKMALGPGMAILENLNLSAVPAGMYELIALPLPLVGVEASPVRAVLRKL